MRDEACISPQNGVKPFCLLTLREAVSDGGMRRWEVQECCHQAGLGLNVSSITSLAGGLNSFETEVPRLCLTVLKILSVS